MLVKHVMHERHMALSKSNKLVDAIRHYIENECNCVPIVDKENRPVGILTVFHLLDNLLAGVSWDAQISEVIEAPTEAVNENMAFEDIQNMPIERLLVLNDNEQLVGVLSKIKLINKVYKSFDKTQQELRVIMESIQNGIIAVDSQGIITHFNRAMEEISGIPAGPAMGQPLDQVVTDPELLSVLDRELPFTHRHIGQGEVLVRTSPIIKQSERIGSVFTCIDMSEIDRISCELESVKTLNQQMEKILNISSCGILIVDLEGNTLFRNPQWEALLDSPNMTAMLAGKQGLENASTEEQFICNHFQLTLAAGSTSPISQVISGEQGREFILTISPITDDGGHLFQYILKLDDMTEINELRSQAAKDHQELQALRLLRNKEGEPDPIVYNSPAMCRIFQQAERLAHVETIVLITGESGVGKEVIARHIVSKSPRASRPFIQINCGAIPEHLFESELFGYEKGSFTGSLKEGKIGLLESANHGTVLLDEIGEMPMALQVKLLRFLQENEFYRVGGRKAVPIDVRILAATNRNLENLVAEGQFRKDLYYRLNVVPIALPPLRERKEDILPLATLFLQQFNQKHNRSATLSWQTCFCLEAYSWPGNIRELMNTIERLIIMGEDGMITPDFLPETISARQSNCLVEAPPGGIRPLNDAVAQLESELIKRAVSEHKSLRPAAQALGISHPTLLRKMRKYGIGS